MLQVDSEFGVERERVVSVLGEQRWLELIQGEVVGEESSYLMVTSMLGVRSFSELEVVAGALGDVGYDCLDRFDGVIPEMVCFQRTSENGVVFVLEVVQIYSETWRRRLFFRNYRRLYDESISVMESEKIREGFRWETDRLVVLPPHETQFELLSELWSDPDVMAYIGEGTIRNREQSMMGFKKMLDHYYRYGFSLGSVFEKRTGEFVGRAGLIYLAYGRPGDDVEVSYMFKKQVWGRGYATEVARFFLGWAFDHLDVSRVVAVSSPENVRSQNVMTACGMVFDRDILYGRIPGVLFEKIRK